MVPTRPRNVDNAEPSCRIALETPSLGNLRRRVVVVSHIELVVSDSEHAGSHFSTM